MDGTYIFTRRNGRLQRRTVTFSAFPDGDTHCVLDDPQDVQGCRVLIVHSLYPSQNEQLIRLVLLMDMLYDLKAEEISVFVPYLPYARQDKRHMAGESISADTICRLLLRMYCHRLYTIDCHFMRGKSFGKRCGLSIINLSVGKTLIAACRQKIGHDQFEVVGPDKGAAYLTTGHGSKYMHKQRVEYNGSNRQGSYRVIESMRDDHITIGYDTAIIVDDMISTGSTLLHAVSKLQERGLKHIYCVVTHGLFIGDAYDKLRVSTELLLCSDTVPHPFATPVVDDIIEKQVLPDWAA